MINIDPSTLDFLEKLKKNNNREWFDKNKLLYQEAKENMEHFAQSLAEQLAFDDEMKGILPEYRMFRIFRDVRFSKNKAPYKTNFGIVLGSKSKDNEVAFYLHIESKNSFMGGGIYCPSSQLLQRVRQHISKHHSSLNEILSDKKNFKKYFLFEGEKVKTTPKGINKEHPAIDLLRHKDFLGIKKLSNEEVLDKKFQELCFKSFKALYPFIDFLRK